ncbi:myosin-15-like [Neoarius graeffei]|uniref:myosin-15-like n=1 Tax=Neoarius graeffei TaxID=443677 RepID=UPI00298D4D3A|nr:myosin-15-like [Neoarius graeffei]
MIAACARVAGLPLRPLLYTAGTAAAASTLYCYMKPSDGEKATADPEGPPALEDPVCDQATEPALVQPEEVPQDQVTDSVTEAEKKLEKIVVSFIQLEDRVRELEELLSEARRDCDMKSKECERERKAQNMLQGENDEMKETMIHQEKLLLHYMLDAEHRHQTAEVSLVYLEVENAHLRNQLKTLRENLHNMQNLLSDSHEECDKLTHECEREQEAQTILQVKNEEMKETLIHQEELLKVSLAKAEQKHQKAKASIVHLEAENADLVNQLKTVRVNMHDLWTVLSDSHEECDKLKHECELERVAHSILQVENDEMKVTLIHQEELLKVSLAEAEHKHQKAKASIVHLEAENVDLRKQLKTVRVNMHDLWTVLSDSQKECDKLKHECEREQEACRILQAENDEMKETLIHQEELLKVSLSEATQKLQKAEAAIVRLEAKNSDLINQLKKLRLNVHMWNLLSESHKECEKLKHESEREREAHSVLQAENEEMKETLIRQEESLKLSLAKAEQKHQKAEASIVHLEAENVDLRNQLNTLRVNMHDLWTVLSDSHEECDKLKHIQPQGDLRPTKPLNPPLEKEQCEREQEVQTILQVENKEMKETLSHQEELLKVSLAEAEQKHQKAEVSIVHLEPEMSDLANQLKTLRVKVHNLVNLLSETHKECDKRTHECEREREAHSILQAENNKLKETLIHQEELLKVSLAEAEQKLQKAEAAVVHLEAENSDLINQLKTLRVKVHDLENLLSESHKECDKLTHECEREQEACSILQAENDVIMKTVIHKQGSLKIASDQGTATCEKFKDSVTEAEKKLEKIVMSFIQLEDRVRELEELLCDARRDCDMKSKECEREREAHSILQAENDEMKETVSQQEELLKMKYYKAETSIVHLEAENADLRNQLKTVRVNMHDLWNVLSDSQKECDKLTHECERERVAHSILQAENDDIKETLIHQEELLKVSLAEAEQKHQKAEVSIVHLEAENADLINQLKTVRVNLQNTQNLLSDSNKECDKLTHECEREREAHSIFQAENDELKETLIHQEELLKDFLAEAEQKHQKAEVSIVHLEAENADLINQLKTLQGNLYNGWNVLSESHKECDKLTHESEQEQEAHSVLQAENEEMKETLIRQEELLKVSLSEAEQKLQKAEAAIVHLEAANADLTNQLKTLRVTVNDLENLLSDSHKESVSESGRLTASSRH